MQTEDVEDEKREQTESPHRLQSGPTHSYKALYYQALSTVEAVNLVTDMRHY